MATGVLFYRHAHFHTAAFDLGLLGQASWNTLQGRLFATTILPWNYLAEHCAPVLALLSPLFLLWSDIRVLLLAGAIAGGLAGLGVYAIATARGGSRVAALLIQAAFYLAPATSWVTLDEFHPITMAMPAITWAVALLWMGRGRSAVVVGSLALLANEDAALWVAPFGLLVIAAGGRKWAMWGGAVAALAVVWLAGYLFVVTPLVRPHELGASNPPPDLGAFSQCGRTLPDVAGCLLLHPLQSLQRAAGPGDRAALANLLLPTAGLGLLGPSLLASLPRWLVLLLGNQPPSYGNHYVGVMAATTFAAAAESLRLFRRRRLPVWIPAAVVTACSFVAYLITSPLPGGGRPEYLRPSAEELAHVAVARRALALVPLDPAVSVSATGSLLAHLALRPRIYLMDEGAPSPPDYRIVDQRDSYPLKNEELRRRAALWRADPAEETLFDQDDLLVLRRHTVPPAVAVSYRFGGLLTLYGYEEQSQEASVVVTLYWRAERPIDHDYHYFVHLVNVQEQGYSQQDGELVHGLLPASKLAPGQAVREAVTVAAPNRADWSGYHLEVGWYDLPSLQRLALPNGADHADLPLSSG